MKTATLKVALQFNFVADWIEKIGNMEYQVGVGGSPFFSPIKKFDNYLRILATVIRDDGSFNGKSIHAERIAICLHNNGYWSDAFLLFQEIVRRRTRSILYVNPHKSATYVSEPVADKPGKLGYEGLYRFAKTARMAENINLAKILFNQIAMLPTECYPIRLQDVRVESLSALIDLGVVKLTDGRLVADELISAEAHQY